jgi:hypothetical protein
MPLIVRAFPVLSGMKEEVQELARQLTGRRAADAGEFYRSYDIAHESWHLQQSAGGWQVIVVTEVGDLDPAASAYAASQRPFDRWFKDEVKRLTGVSPDQDPLGPPTEEIFHWRHPG